MKSIDTKITQGKTYYRITQIKHVKHIEFFHKIIIIFYQCNITTAIFQGNAFIK